MMNNDYINKQYGWINVKDELPETGVTVLVYHADYPDDLEDDYSSYHDRTDITRKELSHRGYGRRWHIEHPYKQASLYQTAIAGKKWMVDHAPDSRLGYIAGLDEIMHWMHLPPAPNGVIAKTFENPTTKERWDNLDNLVNKYRANGVRKKFNVGDWVIGTGENEGCSQVFEGDYCDYQPFCFLDDYDARNYRLATEQEIKEAKEKLDA